MKTLVLCLSLFIVQSISAKSISELSEYPKFCEIAAKEDVIFQDFKRNPKYQYVLEHLDLNQGLDYLAVITRSYPFILNKIEKFRENDRLGNPLTYYYGSLYGNLSPSTLRYMKVAGELVDLFGDLSNKKIIEIGGGYGGQCKIISDLTGFNSYTLIDLPECCLLAEKYLKTLNVNNTYFISSRNLPTSPDRCRPKEKLYDLVISNYAFSEITSDEQIEYIDKIINKSKSGYITCNFTSDFFYLTSLSLEEILSLITIPGRKIQVLPEEPNSFPGNTLIIWD